MKESGTITIKGLAYEDVVTILISNGYKVTVEAEPERLKFSLNEQHYKITYEKFDYNKLIELDEKLGYTE